MRVLSFLFVLLACCAATASGRSSAAVSAKAESIQVEEPANDEVLVNKAGHKVTLDKSTVTLEIKEFDQPTAMGLAKKLDDLKADTIYLKINSYGGSIHWGMEIIQDLEQRDLKVICIVDWKAYSMGAYLLESPACDERYMTKRSTLLFHEPLVQETGGNAHELRKTADQLDAMAEAMIASTAERLGMSEDAFRAKVSDRNWTLPYRQAEKYNCIDGIVDPKDIPKVTEFEKPSLFQLLFGG